MTADEVTTPLGAAYISKFAVDLLKRSPLPSPKRILIPVTLAISIGSCMLYGLATTMPFNKQGIAIMVIQGLVGGLGAVAATENQKTADAIQAKNYGQ
jgi:hypothetical protein